MWKNQFKNLDKKALALYNFDKGDPKVAFFGALEPPFTCQQRNYENLNTLIIIVIRHNSKK